MYDWIRTAFEGPLVAAIVAGSVYLAFVLALGAVAGWLPPAAALVPSGDALVGGLLYRAAGTAGVFLLGATPVLLYQRAGLVLPIVAPVALLVLLWATSGSESYAVLVFFYPPFLLAAGLALGGVEYATRQLLATGTTPADPLLIAAAAGLVHAAVVVAALELLGRSALSEGALGLAVVGSGLALAVAVPTWLFLQFGLVGPLVGVPAGAVLVVATMATGDTAVALLEAYADLSPYVLLVALLVGAAEYAIRGDLLGSVPG